MLMLMRRRKIIRRWVNRFSGFTKRGAGGWLAIVSAVAYRLRSSVLVNVLFCGKSHLGKKRWPLGNVFGRFGSVLWRINIDHDYCNFHH